MPITAPVLFPFHGQPRVIFGLHGEPFGQMIRQAVEQIAHLRSRANAEHQLAIILGAMNQGNAIRVYRNAISAAPEHSWLEFALSERVQDLGFLFTLAEHDEEHDATIGIIQRGEERITYVHPRRSKLWVTPGDRVIVPLRPQGVRLAGARRKGWSVYLHPLQPARPFRQAG